MNTRTNKKTMYQREHYCMVFAISALLFLFCAYVYFVSASVVHVVIRKEINQEMLLVGSQISELESEYISLQHAVSDDIASQNGFVTVTDKLYIDRTPTSLVLSQGGTDG